MIADSFVYRPFGAFRLLLAALVVAQHVLANMAPMPVAAASLSYEVGSVAVLVFFVLSGFVIAEAVDGLYLDRPGAFCANRLLRIVPHFIVAVVLAFATYATVHAAGRDVFHSAEMGPAAFGLRNVLANLLGFLPLSDRFISINVLEIGWAVRVETVFYIVVWLALVVRVFVPDWRWATILSGFAAIGFAGIFGLALLGRVPSMLRFIPYFGFGWSLYAFLRVTAMKRTSVAGSTLIVCALGMMLEFACQPIRNAAGIERAVLAEAGLLLALLVVLGLLAASGDRIKRRSLQAIDKRLGDLTYPLYLYHAAVMVAVLAFAAERSWTALGFAVLASLVLSVILERVVGSCTDGLRERIRDKKVAWTLG